MRKVIILMIFIFGSVFTQALAQPMQQGRSQAPGIQHFIIEYGDQLNLTDEQKGELIALQVENRDQYQVRGDIQMPRRDRRQFREGRRGGRRDGNFREERREMRQERAEHRLKMRNEVLEILSEDQQEELQSILIDKTERAHEFRTFRNEYLVDEAGIEGDKADEVLDLLNAQSESRLEMAMKRFQNPEEMNREPFADRFQQMKDTNDQLRSILTVDEYESLRKNLGFENHPHRGKRDRRGR